MTRGSTVQQADAREEVARLYGSLPAADRERWLAAVAEEVRRRRMVALRALGQTYMQRGTRFGMRNLDQCMTHFRTAVQTHENSSVPPQF